MNWIKTLKLLGIAIMIISIIGSVFVNFKQHAEVEQYKEFVAKQDSTIAKQLSIIQLLGSMPGTNLSIKFDMNYKNVMGKQQIGDFSPLIEAIQVVTKQQYLDSLRQHVKKY